MKQGRVFSGARPTGRQHIGNYLGALQNWVELQEEYDCLYCVVDVHAFTTGAVYDVSKYDQATFAYAGEDVSCLKDNIREMVLDWLTVGLDPGKSIIFVQSWVPQVMELHTLLGMVTPLGWLLRVPTFKEKARRQPGNVNYGLVGYPVLMAADILLYKANVIPVGEDQLPHLELTREIAHRFNRRFGHVFSLPEAKLTPFPLVPGLDGTHKMSKSYNNHIELCASPEEIRERVMNAFTDPARRYRSDPGHPEVCNIHRLQQFFNKDMVLELTEECRKAGIGCVGCKKLLVPKIAQALAPFREQRAEIASREGYVEEVLADGARQASTIAQETIREVKEKMGMLW